MSNHETEKTYGLFANLQNNKLISDLKQKGANLLIMPLIQTEAVELNEDSKELLRNLQNFDWLILTDVFAAEYFIEALRELGVDFFELDNLTVCAFGEAVADRLRFVQVHADIIPSKTDDETIFSAISQFVGDNFDELSFLMIKENSAKSVLSEMLKSKTAKVSELEIYQANIENSSELIKLKTLLENGAVDEFVFSAAEDLASLKLICPENNLNRILSEIRIAATSEIIYQSLQELDLHPKYFQLK